MEIQECLAVGADGRFKAIRDFWFMQIDYIGTNNREFFYEATARDAQSKVGDIVAQYDSAVVTAYEVKEGDDSDPSNLPPDRQVHFIPEGGLPKMVTSREVYNFRVAYTKQHGYGWYE